MGEARKFLASKSYEMRARILPDIYDFRIVVYAYSKALTSGVLSKQQLLNSNCLSIRRSWGVHLRCESLQHFWIHTECRSGQASARGPSFRKGSLLIARHHPADKIFGQTKIYRTPLARESIGEPAFSTVGNQPNC